MNEEVNKHEEFGPSSCQSCDLTPGQLTASRQMLFATLRNHRRTVHQKLRPGNNHLVAGLDALLYFVVVAHGLPDLEGLLPGDERSALLRFGHEGEELASQARYREDRHLRALMRPPNHARANEL